MKWEILILTQPSRREYLKRLLTILAPQIGEGILLPGIHGGSGLGSSDAVELSSNGNGEVWLMVKMFDPKLSLGDNRQAMVDASEAEYISFIDDDDLVAPDYVAKLLPLLDGVDIVGFKVACYVDGAFASTAYHSLRYAGWSNDANGYYRDLSYMQPVRRVLARRSRIEGGYGEDRRWAGRLREIGCVKTEHYLDEVMYHYYYRTTKEEQCVS